MAVAEAALAAGEAADLLIAVEFRGMNEWQDISRKLGRHAGRRGAGGGRPFRARRARDAALRGGRRAARPMPWRQQGLSLRNAGGNWVHRGAIAPARRL